MKPRKKSPGRPLEKRPLRVLLIAGSDRRQYNCPGVDSKARALVLRMQKQVPDEWEIDVEDLGNVFGRERIQSCNACVSTSMALCVWPCNCYRKGDAREPDLMWELDLYARLDAADAWAFVVPVNWWGPSSNIKAMFDRLVCANGGNPDERTIRHKDPELAMALERLPEWEALSQNHLEGRAAGFFVYGDAGANEVDEDDYPKKLRHREWYDPERDNFEDDRESLAPIVWQCRYSGIEVPDGLWTYHEFGAGRPYADNQAEHMEGQDVYGPFDAWVAQWIDCVRRRGKVPPSEYRAWGFEPPPFRLEEFRLAWRDLRMRVGAPRKKSSPKKQQQEGLNEDAVLRPSDSEGEG